MTPRPDNAALLDAILALDLLTLPTHTEQAGDVFDVARHRASLAAALASAQVVIVERNGQVVAYALLLPDTTDRAFVSGFCIHPDWRNASVTQALVSGVFKLARRAGVSTLRSHVYKTNPLSLAFHRRLGFTSHAKTPKQWSFTCRWPTCCKAPPCAGLPRALLEVTPPPSVGGISSLMICRAAISRCSAATIQYWAPRPSTAR